MPGSSAATTARPGGGRISVRWLGGGVTELASPDYKQIAYCDAWIYDERHRRIKHEWMIKIMDAAVALGVKAVCGFKNV